VEDLVAGLRNVPLSGGVVGHVYPGHEHRVVVMLTGPGLSDAVCDTDPGGQAAVQRVISPQPLNDSPAAARTAEALKELTARAGQHLAAHTLNLNRRARGLFEANCLIVRGAAQVTDFPVGAGNPEHRALVAACPTALGVARLLGMQTANTPTMTGNLDTDVDAKFDTVANLLMTHSFVAVHFKGTDIAAHDRRPLKKRDFISSVDRALGRFLNRYSELADGLRIIVSADHGTSSITGNHLPDPVPLLLATWSGPTEEERFDEASARQGALGLLEPGELSEMLWPEEVH
jgi:2,3-bisphosphoglycerate-independent phosphoglycerate mutase